MAKRNTEDDRTPQHLRATPEQVREKWRKGFYTPKGYLHDLIEAFRKQGWWFRIENVPAFCKEWEIKRRTFYKAKAELTAEGELEESIIGIVELRIPAIGCAQLCTPVHDGALPVHDGALPVHDGALPVHDGALPVHDGAQSIAKTLTDSESCEFPRSITDLSQLDSSFLNAQAEQTNTNTLDKQEESEPLDSTIDKAESLSSSKSEELEPTGQDKYSATLDFDSKKEIHPTERCERSYRVEPWGFYSAPNPGFLEFIIKNHLCNVDPYKNYPKITAYHAKKWLNKAKRDEERREEALIEWDAYQAELKESAEMEQVRQLAEIIPLPLPVPAPVENTRESLIARLKGKVRAGLIAQAKAEAIANNIPLEAIGLSEGAAS